MAKVLFLFNGKELAIQCTKEDKMKYICSRFAQKVDINVNSLIFIYGGNKVNYELTFNQLANSMDNNINQMKILVYQIENDGLKCKKCGEKIHLDILDNIIKYNNEQKDTLIEMKNQIDNIIKLNNLSDIIRKIKVIKIILDNLISENEKNLKDIQNDINNNDSSKFRKKDYNLKILGEFNFDSEEQKILKNYVEKSLEQYSDYMDVAKCIFNYCDKWREKKKWSVIVGEKDKYKLFTDYEQMLGVNIGPYKISIIENS